MRDSKIAAHSPVLYVYSSHWRNFSVFSLIQTGYFIYLIPASSISVLERVNYAKGKLLHLFDTFKEFPWELPLSTMGARKPNVG